MWLDHLLSREKCVSCYETAEKDANPRSKPVKLYEKRIIACIMEAGVNEFVFTILLSVHEH